MTFRHGQRVCTKPAAAFPTIRCGYFVGANPHHLTWAIVVWDDDNDSPAQIHVDDLTLEPLPDTPAKHNHGPNFGRREPNCPRCDQLANGAAPTPLSAGRWQ